MESDEKKNTFTVIDDNGKEIECEILFTFESEETKKNYIAYTDHTEDKDGNLKIYASIYDPNSSSGKLIPIETEKEWKIIESIIESIKETGSESEQ